MYHSQNAERRLAMTFQMSQALNVLQMAHLDLQQFIQEEIDKNPLLEDLKKGSHCFDQEIPNQISAFEYLFNQIRETFFDPEERQIAEKITEYLDEKGFLSVPCSEIPVDQTRVESILTTLQTLEPPGIFARSLKESLLIQIKDKSLYSLIENDYEALLHHRYAYLKKKYPTLNLSSAIQKLSTLQLRPLESLKKEIACPIIPDLFIRKSENCWSIGLCNETLPRFRIEYDNLNSSSKEEQNTLDLWRSSGKWLINALRRRREILLQITLRLTHHQNAYLSQKGPLRPFTIQDLVSELGLHESTISRALSEKYVETPLGVILLKSLLTSAPQRKEAKAILQELVAQETTPLTDDQLAHALQEKGYSIARRTISKYRRELKIPPTKTRMAVGKNKGY